MGNQQVYIPLEMPKRRKLPYSFRNFCELILCTDTYLQRMTDIDTQYNIDYTEWMIAESENYMLFLATIILSGKDITYGKLDDNYNIQYVGHRFYTRLYDEYVSHFPHINRYRQHRFSIIPSDIICPICFDEMKDESCILHQCNHRFHIQCIETWFSRSDRCPTCNNTGS
jgi:hypothetical protein